MATKKITLTTKPQKITDGTEGVRIQSSDQFRWVASSDAPTNLLVFHTDKDLYIENKGAIWAWTESRTESSYVVDILVT